MPTISDEELSAYLDGELNNQAKKRIEAAIQDSPTLQRKIAKLKQADQMARIFFEQSDQHAISESLKNTIRNHQAHTTSSRKRNKTQNTAKKVVQGPWYNMGYWAMAASVLLAVAVLWPLTQTGNPLQQRIQHGLATLAQNSVQNLNTDTRLEILWSSENAQGHFCRRYTLHTVNGSSQHQACLVQDNWQIEDLHEVQTDYQLASDIFTPPETVLTAEEEQAWLRRLNR